MSSSVAGNYISVAEWTDTYGTRQWRIFRSSNRKLTWMGFEHSTTQIRLDALKPFSFHFCCCLYSRHIYRNQSLAQEITRMWRNELAHLVFITEGFLEVALESSLQVDSNRANWASNSFYTKSDTEAQNLCLAFRGWPESIPNLDDYISLIYFHRRTELSNLGTLPSLVALIKFYLRLVKKYDSNLSHINDIQGCANVFWFEKLKQSHMRFESTTLEYAFLCSPNWGMQRDKGWSSILNVCKRSDVEAHKPLAFRS